MLIVPRALLFLPFPSIQGGEIYLCIYIYTDTFLYLSVHMLYVIGSHQYLQFSPNTTYFFLSFSLFVSPFSDYEKLDSCYLQCLLILQSLIYKQLPDNIGCPLSHIAVDSHLLRVLPIPVQFALSTSALDSQESPPNPGPNQLSVITLET